MSINLNKDDFRYEELYELAVSRYLDKTDWDIYEWLDDDEKEEYESLCKKFNGEV
jgi:succinate dehydrogenase flavin-adding protein (antitoxin of CptAB toxin-antitoxin module)